ncbi:MAG TPA: ERF family protein [Jiangellaceae bacterium]
MTAWETSEESDKVIPAFVKALHTVEDVVKDRAVVAGPMRYSYADLSTVLDEVRPKLQEHGLAQSQVPDSDGVTTTLFHESGQWIRFSPLQVTALGATPQNQGSAITYARRYSLLAIMGMATEDDDAHSASVATATGGHSEMDPVHDRINTVLRQMKELPDDDKARLKEWADGRSLSAKSLYEDRDWLSEVEAFLDEGLGTHDDDDDDDDDPEP